MEESLGKAKEKTKTRKERATTTTTKERDQRINNLHNNHFSLINHGNHGREMEKVASMDDDPTTPRAKEKEEKATRITTTTVDPKAVTTTTTKERERKGNKGPPIPPYKGKSKGQGGKRNDTVCYYCGKPGHTSDKCWWKGQIYNIDQAQPVCSIPNDNQPQQLQQLPQSSVSTTIMTQPQQTRLENMSLYEQGSFQTGVLSITGSTLIVNKDNTTTNQLRRWAVLIDT
eukprot:381502-Amphidinium_carterae.1